MPRDNRKNPKNFSKKLSTSGFSLIELMLVIMIMVGIFAFGIVRYRDFQRSQSLEAAARTLISDLRFAQEKALAGTKPASCDTLSSYVLSRESSTRYRIIARCGSDIVTKTSDQTGFYSLHPGITLGSFSDVVFNVLGKGVTSSVSIVLTQAVTGFTRTVSVSTGGDIK